MGILGFLLGILLELDSDTNVGSSPPEQDALHTGVIEVIENPMVALVVVGVQVHSEKVPVFANQGLGVGDVSLNSVLPTLDSPATGVPFLLVEGTRHGWAVA